MHLVINEKQQNLLLAILEKIPVVGSDSMKEVLDLIKKLKENVTEENLDA